MQNATGMCWSKIFQMEENGMFIVVQCCKLDIFGNENTVGIQ